MKSPSSLETSRCLHCKISFYYILHPVYRLRLTFSLSQIHQVIRLTGDCFFKHQYMLNAEASRNMIISILKSPLLSLLVSFKNRVLKVLMCVSCFI